jgi:hypothetical protein
MSCAGAQAAARAGHPAPVTAGPALADHIKMIISSLENNMS